MATPRHPERGVPPGAQGGLGGGAVAFRRGPSPGHGAPCGRGEPLCVHKAVGRRQATAGCGGRPAG
eukprot:4524941-Lingulodinium_polyedra.AAC.1